MTQPRRPDEIALYAALRDAAERGAYGQLLCLGSTWDTAASALGVPVKRAWYLADKWERKGWYEQSSFPPGGWFTEAAPDHLDPRDAKT